MALEMEGGAAGSDNEARGRGNGDDQERGGALGVLQAMGHGRVAREVIHGMVVAGAREGGQGMVC